MAENEPRIACTRATCGMKPIVQPLRVVEISSGGKVAKLCSACASHCAASGPPAAKMMLPLEPFVCQSIEIVSQAPWSFTSAQQFAQSLQSGLQAAASTPPQALEDERLRQLEGAIQQQSEIVQVTGEASMAMSRRLQSLVLKAQSYESPELQQQARDLVPVAQLAETADRLEAEGKWFGRDADLKALMQWFKRDFFKWCNKPHCEQCSAKGKRQTALGMAQPTDFELAHGAQRVELYQCDLCGHHNRFPRFDSVPILLTTRRGRCGEWANAFTLFCRAFAFEARFVLDWTDHVWTEVWSDQQQRWLHADPCENRLDRPLMYERGWGKKLSYILAVARDHILDVTPRYTNAYYDIMTRRVDLPERELTRLLTLVNSHLSTASRSAAAAVSPAATIRTPAGSATSLQARLVADVLALSRRRVLHGIVTNTVTAEERMGRQTGDVEWRRVRGEMGDGKSEQCVDWKQACSIDFLSEHIATPQDGCSPISAVTLAPNGLLQVTVISAGYEDNVGRRMGHSCFTEKCITVNGLPLARGSRGHNLVALSEGGALLLSECFDTWGEPSSGQKLIDCLEALPLSALVFITVIDSGDQHANDHRIMQSMQAFLPKHAYPSLANKWAPSRRTAWIFIGKKKVQFGDPFSKHCGVWTASGPKRGPIARQINFNLSSALAFPLLDSSSLVRVRGGRCAQPDCRLPDKYMPLSEQRAATVQDHSCPASIMSAVTAAMLEAENTWVGFSWREGDAVWMFTAEHGLPLSEDTDWFTYMVKAPEDLSTEPPESHEESLRIQELGLALFHTLCSSTHQLPSPAASCLALAYAHHALEGIALSSLVLQDGSVSDLIVSETFGGSHGDTETLDVLESISPVTTCSAYPLKVSALRVWEAVDDGIVGGVQLLYRSRLDAHGEMEGPVLGKQDQLERYKLTTVRLREGEAVTSIHGQAGALVDRLEFTTSCGHTHAFGGTGGSHFHIDFHGGELMALGGGYGGHVHHFQCSFLRSFSSQAPTFTPPTAAVLCVPRGDWATRHAVLRCWTDGGDVTGLECTRAAVKYGRNLARCVREKGDMEKFAKVRVLNRFMDSKVTQRPGGLSLMSLISFVNVESASSGAGQCNSRADRADGHVTSFFSYA